MVGFSNPPVSSNVATETPVVLMSFHGKINDSWRIFPQAMFDFWRVDQPDQPSDLRIPKYPIFNQTQVRELPVSHDGPGGPLLQRPLLCLSYPFGASFILFGHVYEEHSKVRFAGTVAYLFKKKKKRIMSFILRWVMKGI